MRKLLAATAVTLIALWALACSQPTSPPTEATAVPHNLEQEPAMIEPVAETAVPLPTVTLSPTAAQPIYNNLADSLAQLPPIPALTLPPEAALFTPDDGNSGPWIEIVLHTVVDWDDLVALYEAILPDDGWQRLESSSELGYRQAGTEVWIWLEPAEERQTQQMVVRIQTPQVTADLPPLPLPADAEVIAYRQSFLYTTAAELESVLEYYADFYLQALRPFAWAPSGNYKSAWFAEYVRDSQRIFLRFNRARSNEIVIDQVDYSPILPIRAQMRLRFDRTDHGYQYAAGDCFPGRNVVVAHPPPPPADLEHFITDAIHTYSDLIQEAMANHAIQLICQEPGAAGVYEFLIGETAYFHLEVTSTQEAGGVWRIRLHGHDLDKEVADQFLFWLDVIVPGGQLDVESYLNRQRQPIELPEVLRRAWRDQLVVLSDYLNP